jgi:biopolymer transport protein ExbD
VSWRQNGENITHEVMPENVPAEMPQVLSTARTAQPSARMIVKMDKDARYGVMADLMPALQAAKAPRFNVQTELGTKGGLFGKAPGH